MKDLKNILSTDENTFSDEELLRLMQEDLHHEVEKEIYELIQEDSFVADALEGLKHTGDSTKINQSVLKLNNHLQKNILTKAKKRKMRTLPSNQWAIIAIVIVITLCLIGYFLIELTNKH